MGPYCLTPQINKNLWQQRAHNLLYISIELKSSNTSPHWMTHSKMVTKVSVRFCLLYQNKNGSSLFWEYKCLRIPQRSAKVQLIWHFLDLPLFVQGFVSLPELVAVLLMGGRYPGRQRCCSYLAPWSPPIWKENRVVSCYYFPGATPLLAFLLLLFPKHDLFGHSPTLSDLFRLTEWRKWDLEQLSPYLGGTYLTQEAGSLGILILGYCPSNTKVLGSF